MCIIAHNWVFINLLTCVLKTLLTIYILKLGYNLCLHTSHNQATFIQMEAYIYVAKVAVGSFFPHKSMLFRWFLISSMIIISFFWGRIIWESEVNQV